MLVQRCKWGMSKVILLCLLSGYFSIIKFPSSNPVVIPLAFANNEVLNFSEAT